MKIKIISFSLLILFNNLAFSQDLKSADSQSKKAQLSKKVNNESKLKKTYSSNETPKPSKISVDFRNAYNSGNLEIADMLLSQGADINCTNCDGSKSTALIITAQNPVNTSKANPNLSWLLSRKADINLQNSQGETALMKSVTKVFFDNYSGFEDVLFLMNNGAKTGMQDKSGKNALHHLAVAGVVPIGAGGWPLETTKFMNSRYETTAKNLLTSGVNVNEKDLAGNTVLNYAAASCNPTVVNFYLSNGADKSLKNEKGESALDVAMSKAVYQNSKFCNETVSILK